MKARGLAVVALVALVAAPLRAEDSDEAAMTGNLPEHHAADADAPAITAATLLANDRFWPYLVGLAGAGDDALGVLIRVDAKGTARIDFGRDGLREIPVAKTDLVERANRVRRGELEKMAPNFLLAHGPRLVDAAGEQLRPLPYSEVAGDAGFLCVFADPASVPFPALAAALAPLQNHRGVRTILFAQGDIADPLLRDRLRELEWPVPFVFDHLAEAYTRSLLATDAKPPFVMLVTREGRVLYQGSWKASTEPELRAALEAAFEAAPAKRTAAAEPTPAP
jgi:hypothetical protein